MTRGAVAQSIVFVSLRARETRPGNGRGTEKRRSAARTHDRFAVFEHELLIELSEVEPVLALAALDVDFAQELSHEFDHLWQREFVRVVLWRVLETGLEQERVSSETSRWLRQVRVQFELS